MPVDTNVATRWEEQALAKYLLDPGTGLPVASGASPVRGRLPGLDLLGSTSFSLDGSLPKWLVASDGATVITISARGGEVYYNINGVTANANSPGYVADGGVQTVGPVCNMTSLWVFSSTADTMVHVNFYRETRSRLAGTWQEITYVDKVLSYNPILYYPMNETAGVTAVNAGTLGSAADGAYTGVTLNNTTGPDGTNGAPYFDGVNDYLDGTTAALIAALSLRVGSVLIWLKVANAGVWTDGTTRGLVYPYGLAGKQYRIAKLTGASSINYYGNCNAGVCSVNQAGLDTTAWVAAALTWSDGANDDEFIPYYDGAAVDVPCTSLNVCNQALTSFLVGALATTPTGVFHGWLAHCMAFDRVLPAAEVLALSTI